MIFHEFLIQGGLGGAEHPPARYKVKGPPSKQTGHPGGQDDTDESRLSALTKLIIPNDGPQTSPHTLTPSSDQ